MKTILLSPTDTTEHKQDLRNALREAYLDEEQGRLLKFRKDDNTVEAVLVPFNESFEGLFEDMMDYGFYESAGFKWDDPGLSSQLGLTTIQCAFSDGQQKFIFGDFSDEDPNIFFAVVDKGYYETFV